MLLSNILILFVIFYNILIIKTLENNNIAVMKFKTYYPLSYNILYNKPEYNREDFIENIHFSKIYLEMEVGDENNFKNNTNQTLKTIIDLNDIIFSTTSRYFRKWVTANNDLLCHFNTSKSTTFETSQYYFLFDNIESLSAYSKEKFKIKTDISLTKYNITQIQFVNTIDHNRTGICGNIGLININAKYIDYDFMHQLHKNLNLPEICYFFNYSRISKDEGIFIVGNMPHVYLPNKYNIDELLSIYSSNQREPKIYFDELKIEGYNMEDMDEQYQVLLTPNVECLEFPEEYFYHIKNFYFKEYINKSICNVEYYNFSQYEIIYCQANDDKDDKVVKEIIKNFPKIYFKRYKNNFTVFFDGNDLFYYKENKYFFKIIKNKERDFFLFGRLFFQKYIAIFNIDRKQIIFYNNNLQGKDRDDDKPVNLNIILIIICVICAIVFFGLGIIFGKKLFERRSKRANELADDDYQYKSDNNTKEIFDSSINK
jgi:hypothetical protein